MPTGYTSDIYEGKDVSSSNYILKCARAFGALIEMRDYPMDAEIPEFKVSEYHLEHEEAAKNELKRYENMSVEEAEKDLEEVYKRKVASNREVIKKKEKLKQRYMYVLAGVKQWEPPTEEHIKLKEYAIEQLETSIYHDCNTEYYEREPYKQTGAEYLKEMIKRCEDNVLYHQKEYLQEVQRVNNRNNWVKELKLSLEN
ncbi:hypothetical protein P4V72_30790 [Bacillus thuringiensis]|uniref:Uncharacterized protein n=1 Tax=Bacillus thuringiensis TaxID=1428 RepID=A0A9W3XHT9_BACTU|nr:hypothetical protein [Bacillus thuringiensis]AQY37887.1 hypothetical protein B4918_07635 [Bacillus thuringiensis]MDR4151145.1 hypothetical protein [Bacillus thuringiensis]MEC3575740.1 hypothetical protein [Bacillus thuringiensis]MED2022519.1 hypothetical protein [Bacillus thuringiensis]MED2145482.1 hypothetical protein [Bacillus thuringiensis]